MNPQTKRIKLTKTGLSILLVLVLNACSHGLRIKNLINYPIQVSQLDILDSLKLQPQFIRYTGTEEKSFIHFSEDVRIQGRQNDRPVWSGTRRGCFLVEQNANVHILDFNFNGSQNDTTTIRLKSGSLILENCDFGASEVWAIQVDSGAYLELRNTQFSNLPKGAVRLEGGQTRIFNSRFDQVGKVAIHAQAGQLFEAHNVTLTNTMGSGIELTSVSEVWLDSVRVIDSFQDGIVLNNCEYTLLNQIETRENGRNGLSVSESEICGVLNFSALGNLVHGIVISDVDTLRMVNSEFVGNGENGGIINSTRHSRLAGIRVGHNGNEGLKVHGGEELIIDRASFQAHPSTALEVDSLETIRFERMSFVNNKSGFKISNFDTFSISNCLLTANQEYACDIRNGNQVDVSLNLIQENNRGLTIERVLNTLIDSNRVESNTSGADFRSIPILKLKDNVWVGNKSAAYFSAIGLVQIESDQWRSSSETALEVLSAQELIMTNTKMVNNKTACLLNEVSAKISSSRLDSSSASAIKLMNSTLLVEESQFSRNNIALEIAEGSRARVVQSEFRENELTILTQPSVSLSLSFSSIDKSRAGLQIGNYGDAELLSNRFNEIDGYCVELTGPHLQSLLFRQNIVSQTGGIVKSKSNSGKIEIYSNTFSRNLSGLTLRPKTLGRLDHNIFFHTETYNVGMLKVANLAKWNCIFPSTIDTTLGELIEDTNLYIDPQFDLNHYLKIQSPCLTGGNNGMLIGALGALPEARPTLQP